MAFPGPPGPYSSLSLSDVPYEQKWELLKPHIHRLYIEENRSLPEVISMMKREFSFDAKSVDPNLALCIHLLSSEANQPCRI
jgi:Clr5 domain